MQCAKKFVMKCNATAVKLTTSSKTFLQHSPTFHDTCQIVDITRLNYCYHHLPTTYTAALYCMYRVFWFTSPLTTHWSASHSASGWHCALIFIYLLAYFYLVCILS